MSRRANDPKGGALEELGLTSEEADKLADEFQALWEQSHGKAPSSAAASSSEGGVKIPTPGHRIARASDRPKAEPAKPIGKQTMLGLSPGSPNLGGANPVAPTAKAPTAAPAPAVPAFSVPRPDGKTKAPAKPATAAVAAERVAARPAPTPPAPEVEERKPPSARTHKQTLMGLPLAAIPSVDELGPPPPKLTPAFGTPAVHENKPASPAEETLLDDEPTAVLERGNMPLPTAKSDTSTGKGLRATVMGLGVGTHAASAAGLSLGDLVPQAGPPPPPAMPEPEEPARPARSKPPPEPPMPEPPPADAGTGRSVSVVPSSLKQLAAQAAGSHPSALGAAASMPGTPSVEASIGGASTRASELDAPVAGDASGASVGGIYVAPSSVPKRVSPDALGGETDVASVETRVSDEELGDGSRGDSTRVTRNIRAVVMPTGTEVDDDEILIPGVKKGSRKLLWGVIAVLAVLIGVGLGRMAWRGFVKGQADSATATPTSAARKPTPARAETPPARVAQPAKKPAHEERATGPKPEAKPADEAKSPSRGAVSEAPTRTVTRETPPSKPQPAKAATVKPPVAPAAPKPAAPKPVAAKPAPPKAQAAPAAPKPSAPATPKNPPNRSAIVRDNPF